MIEIIIKILFSKAFCFNCKIPKSNIIKLDSLYLFCVDDIKKSK